MLETLIASTFVYIAIFFVSLLQDHRYINQSLLKITFNVPPVRYEQTLDTFLEIYFK